MRHALTTVAAILLATGTAAQVTTAEQAVRARDDKERLAALNRDVAALEDLWSADFTVNAPNNTVAAGRKAVMNAFVASNVIDFSSFERQVEYVKVDGSFAVIMGLETVTSKGDAPAAGLAAGKTIQRRFTNIWKNESGTWRLYWRHASVIPAK